MAKCFSITETHDNCYRRSFRKSGLKSSTTDLGDGTVMHCWIPKVVSESKPTLVLIHGFGANAMWQFKDFLPRLKSKFNLYVPDLLFFGESFTTRPERSEVFQAECVMGVMTAHNVERMDAMGLSYGGFVAYRMAAQFEERVGRVVLGCAGVCLEEKDMEDGMFRVKTVEEAVSILLPQTPEKARELVRLAFYDPPKTLPSCFLNDFIQVMCTENRQEKRELIHALHKDRKFSDLPKITQPTLMIWGEHDKVFPLPLAHRLQRHVGEKAELVVIKKVGHALNVEAPKQVYKSMVAFLLKPLPPPPKQELNQNNG